MDKAILSIGAERFDVDGSELQLLGGFSNNVFECMRNGESFILKFYHSPVYRERLYYCRIGLDKFFTYVRN